MRGAPPPRGGERGEPSPPFVAHAAALTGFYVAFATELREDVALVAFAREGEAREPFRARDGRRRAIAPDARIELDDQDGRRLVGFLEVDLGTMSHRRLRAKARGYADYAHAEAWLERHDFCPALLFATIAERRATTFLDVLASELERGVDLFAWACGLARESARAVTEPVWRTTGGERPLALVAALAEARRPYDEEQAELERARRHRREERRRLLSDPAALREHLRHRRRGMPPGLDDRERAAIELLLEGQDELTEAERQTLTALGGLLADPLFGSWADREPNLEERDALHGLVEEYRSRQLNELAALAEELGEGPALRRARVRLLGGELLRATDRRLLDLDARRDHQARIRQEQFRAAYQQRRQEEARALAKAQGLAARLRHGPEDFLAEVDRRLLRLCPDCEEIAYPEAEEGLYGRIAEYCLFCGQAGLRRFEASQ